MHNRLENNKDFIVLLKNSGHKDDFINFILELNDQDFKSLKENFLKNKDLLAAISDAKYKRANEYIFDKFYNIKTNNGEYSFSKDENNMYFQQYKEFIILLLDQEFNDDHLLQIFNQLSIHVDRVNDGYHINDPENCMGYIYAYGKHEDLNKLFLEHKDVFVTFFKHFPSHSYNYNNACKALMNIGYSELDKYKSNLPLFRLLVQNDLLRPIKQNIHNNPGVIYPQFTLLNVTKTLLEMNNFKEIKVKNSKELLDLLLERNLITLDQDKRDFIAQNSPVTCLLNIGCFTILELINNPVEKLIQAKIKEIQAQLYPDGSQPILIEDILSKYKYNQDGVQSLLSLSLNTILNPQKTLDSQQVEEIKVTQEKRQNSWCSIL